MSLLLFSLAAWVFLSLAAGAFLAFGRPVQW